MRYEYIRLEFDLGNLSVLNNYSMNGWRVVQIIKNPKEISKVFKNE